MQLKNCRIGVLLEDYLLRQRITDLLMRNGAVVHCARDEEEMAELLRLMDLDVAVVGAPQRAALRVEIKRGPGAGFRRVRK